MVLGWLAGRSPAAEEWADPNLKVTIGLELWLDASRLNAAAKANAKPALNNGDPVEIWYDASGHKRHALQPIPSCRPAYWTDLVKEQAQSVLRFDGMDDRLAIFGVGKDLQSCTLFLVAAPSSNAGSYRAFLAISATGQNDYLSGLNIDQGQENRTSFDRLNIEGRGFSGEQNLLSRASDFGTFHILTVTSTTAKDGTRLFVDGQYRGMRPRSTGVLRMDEVRIGARSYSNTAAPVDDSGFFDGCIAEVLMYDRVLSVPERDSVEKYLREKYAGLLKLKGLGPQVPIHILVPGFTVRELPVQLTNINGLTYAPDGRLFALGYDGRIHVLRDTDGDGLEDKAEVFWDKPTLRTPISLSYRAEGLYVVSNGKVSLFHDAGKGKAEREEIVVSGWAKDDGTTGGGVDALGLAFDRQDNLYFGLGCADYTNAYRIKDGKARYDLRSERGTILKVSPDRKRREIVCTGIRFPYAIAINRHGDVFCTDQEGETWLPGGNPLDELNHIIPGRHYGFPPRHEKYLPNIYDEPPVVAFGPQHQSSCGMVFNEVKPGRKAFGPEFWEGEALVAGWSRGKIWRIRLVKTPTGYVGRSIQIAALSMLTLDMAISPSGDLVVCCHSGMPDWGTGPSGTGRLFKISYTDPSAVQPVIAWAAGPLEARVAFDRPVDPSFLNTPAASAITFGEHVRAADRFEVLRPGYESVQTQLRAFRGQIHIASAKLSADRRTLILTTDPHPMRGTYSLTVPIGPPRHSALSTRRGGVTPPLHSALDLAYDLSGVEATWTSSEPAPLTTHHSPLSTWLPHLDLAVAKGMTGSSADHEQFRSLLHKPGQLHLRTRVQFPVGPIVLRLVGGSPFEIQSGGVVTRSAASTAGEHDAHLAIASEGKPVDLAVKLRTGVKDGDVQLHVSYHTGNDPTVRPVPIGWLFVPWAPAGAPTPAARNGPAPELVGGDWKRGEAIFFSQEANCSTCHVIRGKGGKIGPDLSNLIHRDAASVLRDIVDPSAAINPDYVPYTVVLKGDRLLTGLVRAEGEDKIRVIDSNAQETVLPVRDVEQLQASTVSTMPKGYAELLGREKLKDLLTYLTTPLPAIENQRPPGRSRAEVEAVLRESAAVSEKPGTLNIVLVAGPKDHGPGEHDYPSWQRQWRDFFSKSPGVRVSIASGWPDRGQWDLADVVVFYFWNHEWSADRFKDLDSYLARGGGLVALHSAVIHDKDPQSLALRLGLAAHPVRTKYRHGPLELKITAPTKQPITRALTTLRFVDESYWPLIGEVNRVDVLATTLEEGKPQPMLWTYQPGKGRVFCSILGHYSWTFDDPLFRVLLLRGVAWAAGEPVDRFNALITEGVTWQEKR